MPNPSTDIVPFSPGVHVEPAPLLEGGTEMHQSLSEEITRLGALIDDSRGRSKALERSQKGLPLYGGRLGR